MCKTKPKPVKTFKISYNEDYTTPLVGYGITTGEKLERMPSHIGQDKTAVETWCAERSITCTFTEVTNEAPKGQIVSQDQYQGVLLKPIKSIKYEYSDGMGTNIQKPETEEDNLEEEEENNKKDENENTGTEQEGTNENENNNENPVQPNEPTPPIDPGVPTPEPTPDTPTENPIKTEIIFWCLLL